MCRPKRISSTIAAIVALMFPLSAICAAQAGPVRKGKLVLTNLEVESDVPGLDRPPCKAPPLCHELIADVKKVLRLAGMPEIGILVIPAGGDIELRTFALEIRSNNRVVFTTQPIDEVLKTAGRAKQTNGGYLFKLDESAIAAGNKFFVAENAIALTVKTSGKAEPKFYLVNVGKTKAR